ncbi:MAG: ABC transporter substrate-binding protein, partial [Lachnospirales bacterium]
MKLNKIIALACAAVMTLGVVGCGSSAGTDSASSDTIKIGGIGPITGEQASYGISVQNGCQIAVDEINAAGGVCGKQLELLFEDDECNEQKSVNAYNTLMDKGINALVGSVTSACSIAVGNASQKDGILQITPSGSAAECTAGSNAFRICFTDPLQGETMAQYIKDAGLSKVAIIYNNGDEYSKGIHDAFVAKFGELGGEVVCDESYTTKDVDFKTQLTKVQSSDAECIFLPIYYADVAKITEQAASLGLKLPYYGADGWDGVIKQLNGDTTNIEGATFLTPFVATDSAENIQKFVKAYNENYNATPDQFAADGYDAVYAVKAAIEQTNGDLSNEALV